MKWQRGFSEDGDSIVAFVPKQPRQRESNPMDPNWTQKWTTKQLLQVQPPATSRRLQSDLIPQILADDACLISIRWFALSNAHQNGLK
jgi:hypothetical protein